jgi:hypothetical protein
MVPSGFRDETAVNRASRSRPSFFVRDHRSCCSTLGPINLIDGLNLIISSLFRTRFLLARRFHEIVLSQVLTGTVVQPRIGIHRGRPKICTMTSPIVPRYSSHSVHTGLIPTVPVQRE